VAPVNCSVLIPQPLQEGAVNATKTLARGRLLLPLPAQSSPAVDEQILDGFSKVHVFFIFPLGQFIFFFFSSPRDGLCSRFWCSVGESVVLAL